MGRLQSMGEWSRGEGVLKSRGEWGLLRARVSGAGVSGCSHSRGEWDIHRAGVSGVSVTLELVEPLQRRGEWGLPEQEGVST